jgi:plastocyanin
MTRGRIAWGLAFALVASDPDFVATRAAKAGSGPLFISEAVAAPAPRSQPHVVTIDSFAFKPPVVTVKQGDTVEWRNTDPVPHTATSKAAGFDSGSIAAGATYRFVAKKKGRFDYLCTFHPIMKGTVVVE